MRSLLAKILLAQVITVVLALLVVMSITRSSLNRGFVEFLERQEAGILNVTAPALAQLYRERGSWAFVLDHPDSWHRILRHTRNLQPRRGEHRAEQRPRPPGREAAVPSPADPPLRWLGSMDRLHMRERLFLLDAEHAFVAGAPVEDRTDLTLQAVLVDGEAVGWIGFAPMGKVLPPEAQRFLLGQAKVLSVSLLVALGLAALLGFLLARHLSRPVRALAATVAKLSDGQYDERASATGRDEIGMLAQAVNRLAETLEKNRTARRRWMADIAHELRTPVAILKGEIEALADGVRQPDGQKLSSLAEEVDQLAVLIEDLQTLALSDAGALNLHREPLEINALVQQVAEAFTERLAARGIVLETNLPGTVTLSADPQRLRQLIHNLLENCARYVMAGGWVKVALARTASGVSLSVEDSGPGVPSGQLEHLFDRFFRLEQSRSRVGGGSGLGLSICRNIVEAHGGRIQARRGDSGGLLIIIELPD
jgi:two-component system sensor histidine kinase BaeS